MLTDRQKRQPAATIAGKGDSRVMAVVLQRC